MHLEGTHTFAAPRETVWDILMNPDTLSQALPGSEGLEQIGDNQYGGNMNVRVGPVQGRFSGKVELSDVQPPERYRITVNGKGAPGFIRGEGDLHLEALEDATVLHYKGDLQVGGRIAGVGQRLLDSTARSLTRQSLEALDRQLEAASAPASDILTTPMPTVPHSPPVPAAAAGLSPTTIAAEVAKDVSRDLLSDYMPATARQWLIPIAVTLGVFLFCRLCRRLGRDR